MYAFIISFEKLFLQSINYLNSPIVAALPGATRWQRAQSSPNAPEAPPLGCPRCRRSLSPRGLAEASPGLLPPAAPCAGRAGPPPRCPPRPRCPLSGRCPQQRWRRGPRLTPSAAPALAAPPSPPAAGPVSAGPGPARPLLAAPGRAGPGRARRGRCRHGNRPRSQPLAASADVSADTWIQDGGGDGERGGGGRGAGPGGGRDRGGRTGPGGTGRDGHAASAAAPPAPPRPGAAPRIGPRPRSLPGRPRPGPVPPGQRRRGGSGRPRGEAVTARCGLSAGPGGSLSLPPRCPEPCPGAVPGGKPLREAPAAPPGGAPRSLPVERGACPRAFGEGFGGGGAAGAGLWVKDGRCWPAPGNPGAPRPAETGQGSEGGGARLVWFRHRRVLLALSRAGRRQGPSLFRELKTFLRGDLLAASSFTKGRGLLTALLVSKGLSEIRVNAALVSFPKPFSDSSERKRKPGNKAGAVQTLVRHPARQPASGAGRWQAGTWQGRGAGAVCARLTS